MATKLGSVPYPQALSWTTPENHSRKAETRTRRVMADTLTAENTRHACRRLGHAHENIIPHPRKPSGRWDVLRRKRTSLDCEEDGNESTSDFTRHFPVCTLDVKVHPYLDSRPQNLLDTVGVGYSVYTSTYIYPSGRGHDQRVISNQIHRVHFGPIEPMLGAQRKVQ